MEGYDWTLGKFSLSSSPIQSALTKCFELENDIKFLEKKMKESKFDKHYQLLIYEKMEELANACKDVKEKTELAFDFYKNKFMLTQ
jgi:hypothetical protein